MTTALMCWHSVDAMRARDDIEADIAQLHSKTAAFAQLHDEHTRRFDEHTGRLEEHDQRLAADEERTTSHDMSLAAMQAELAEQKQKTQQFENFFRQFQADTDRKMAAMEAELKERRTRMANFQGLERKVQQQEARLAAAETMIRQQKALLLATDEKVKIDTDIYVSTLIRRNGILGSIETGFFKGDVLCDGVIVIGNGHPHRTRRSLLVNGKDIYSGSSPYDICSVKRNDKVEAHGVNFTYCPVEQ